MRRRSQGAWSASAQILIDGWWGNRVMSQELTLSVFRLQGPGAMCSWPWVVNSFHLGGWGEGYFVFQLLGHVWLFATPWTAAHEASLSFTISRSLLKLRSIESVMPSNHLILFSCLQSFPASGSFLMSQLFASGGQSQRASALASVLPMIHL